jgi:hypothetical protein
MYWLETDICIKLLFQHHSKHKLFMKIKNKCLFKPKLLGIAFLISLSSIPIALTPGVAQVTFNPPKAQAPKTSSGGASRDGSSCGFDTRTNPRVAVTPLLPRTNIGFTVAERPTVLVYVPQTTAKKAIFSLEDEQANQHYQTTLRLPNKPGVMAVKLPNSVPALKTGKNYQWSLVMICTEDLEPDSPWVSGWIRRVEPNPSLKNQPNLTASVELASKLARMGLWYDSVSTLAQLKRSQPNNPTVATSWQELLKSVGLNAIANQPLAN